MKATEQYFSVLLFLVLHKVVQTFQSGWNPMVWPLKWNLLSSTFLWYRWILLCCTRWSLKCDHSNESYWAALSCDTVYMLNKVVLSFECMHDILWCDHSNKMYWEVPSCDIVYYAVQSGSYFWVWVRRSSVTIQMKATEEYFPVVVLIMLYEIVVNFETVDEFRKCDHINESCWTVNSCGDVYAMKGACKHNVIVNEAMKCSKLISG